MSSGISSSLPLGQGLSDTANAVFGFAQDLTSKVGNFILTAFPYVAGTAALGYAGWLINNELSSEERNINSVTSLTEDLNALLNQVENGLINPLNVSDLRIQAAVSQLTTTLQTLHRSPELETALRRDLLPVLDSLNAEPVGVLQADFKGVLEGLRHSIREPAAARSAWYKNPRVQIAAAGFGGLTAFVGFPIAVAATAIGTGYQYYKHIQVPKLEAPKEKVSFGEQINNFNQNRYKSIQLSDAAKSPVYFSDRFLKIAPTAAQSLSTALQAVVNDGYLMEKLPLAIKETVKNEALLFSDVGAAKLGKENSERISVRKQKALLEISKLFARQQLSDLNLYAMAPHLSALYEGNGLDEIQGLSEKNKNRINQLSVLLEFYGIVRWSQDRVIPKVDVDTYFYDAIRRFMPNQASYPENASECNPVNIVSALAEAIDREKVGYVDINQAKSELYEYRKGAVRDVLVVTGAPLGENRLKVKYPHLDKTQKYRDSAVFVYDSQKQTYSVFVYKQGPITIDGVVQKNKWVQCTGDGSIKVAANQKAHQLSAQDHLAVGMMATFDPGSAISRLFNLG